MDMNQLLVTGGAGFIGSHLVKDLKSTHSIQVLDQDPHQTKNSSVPVFQGDIRNTQLLSDAMDGADGVIHLAAQVDVTESIRQPIESSHINTFGTLHVLEMARKHDVKVILASSAAVYGEPISIPISESHRKAPQSPYGVGKLAADHYTQLYHDLYGLETIVLRFFNVYGSVTSSNHYSAVIPKFFKRAMQNKPIPLHGDGSQTRDFVHVTDIIQAIKLALQNSNSGIAVNVGTGDAISIRKLAHVIRQTVDSRSEIIEVDPRPGDIEQSCADISRARNILEYAPQIDITKGMQQMYESYARNSK